MSLSLTPPPELPAFIDSTMIRTFKSCPRKFYLEFIRGLRGSGKSIDLHAGGAFAYAIECANNAFHFQGKPLTEAMLICEAAFHLAWGNYDVPILRYSKVDGRPIYSSPKTRDRMWDAVLDYFAKYPLDSDHIKPFALPGKSSAEFTFAVPLTFETTGLDSFPLHPSGSPFLYSGRFDLLGSYLNRPIVRDEKTAKSAPAYWAEQWDLRAQFLGYVWAVEQVLGIECEQVAVRGVIIQVEEIRQLESIKLYTRALVKRWLFQLSRDLNRLVDCWNAGYFDFDFGETCTSYGLCPYFHSCRAADPEMWLTDFTITHWNPLQKDPLAETGKSPLGVTT